MRDDTLMSIRRLIQNREIDLFDGSKLLHHERYDELIQSDTKSLQSKVMRVHPSFRIIATAEPPTAKSALKETENLEVGADGKVAKAAPPPAIKNNEWLNSEVLNLFMYHVIEPLSLRHEHEILNKKFQLNSQHIRYITPLQSLPDIVRYGNTKLINVFRY